MRLSDLISQTILDMLAESESGAAEIKRNDFANKVGCVPSQINYVLSSRFTPENGYIVESRRGGGGYIKITRINLDRSSAIMHIVNSIGNEISVNAARIILENLNEQKVITDEQNVLISTAVSDKCYADIPPIIRNALRASIFKNMLVACI
ncbi:MAG: CtsR family transcriptional regulator [Acutalibacteraceae bacterium]|nr:CtsR family transcriptional regulator [Acutalibacteraceae bacterium]